MCGIAGVFRGAQPGDDRQVVASMIEVLRPRGPDSDGLVVDGPVTLGHRRLAILDLSPAGRQPMESHSGRFVITYNGEIYNFRGSGVSSGWTSPSYVPPVTRRSCWRHGSAGALNACRVWWGSSPLPCTTGANRS